ncbi:hypothetical protein CHFL109739_05345 [Chryseobacterium flavum]
MVFGNFLAVQKPYFIKNSLDYEIKGLETGNEAEKNLINFNFFVNIN